MAVKKKIPMRKCVGCGEMKPKKELMRILRTESGDFVVDAEGKKKRARRLFVPVGLSVSARRRRAGGLERSFKQEIPQEVYDRLERRWARLANRDKVLSLIGLAVKREDAQAAR